MKKQLRALLTGYFHETNTYVKDADMSSFTRTARQDLIDQNRGSNTPYGAYIEYCEKNDVEMVGGVSWFGNPAGMVTNEDYQSMKAEIIAAAKKAGDIDLLMLYFHGAAVVTGVPDPEFDITNSLKEVLGKEVTVIAAGLDLHGKCSEDFNQAVDLKSVVHTYPHIDFFERSQEILTHLPALLDGSLKPTCHVEYLPLIFPTCTTMGDGLGFKILARLKKEITRPDIVDISYMHGFPYTDHEFTGGFVIVTTDNDLALAEKEAKAFAQWIWDQKEALNVPSMTIEEAVQATVQELIQYEDYKPRPKVDLDKLATDKATQDASIEAAKEASWGFIPDWDHKPIVINDTADNPGGGTAGVNTHLLRRLMEENIDRTAYIGLCDPATAKKAHEAGVGAVIDVEMGGGSELEGEPIKAKAYVKMLADGHTMNRIVGGGTKFDIGLTATLIIGSLTITVASIAWQGFDNAQTLIGGIDPKDYRVVAVKSSTHFRAYFTPIAYKVFTADGPGGTTTIVTNFKPVHLRGPVYPFDMKTQYPA